MNVTLEQIWSEFSDKLRQFIEKRVPSTTIAEDILQDVFLKISRNVPRLESSAKLEGWLFLIARNAITDYYRTRKDTVEIAEDIPVENNLGEEELQELKASFRRMVHSLPGPYREAILLTEFDGLSQIELAKRVGISVSGAKSRVQRGREQLKKMLLECCEFEVDRRGHVFDCTPRKRAACPECGAP